MANYNSPFGARVMGTLGGSAYTGVQNAYTVESTDATPLYLGDPIKLVGTAVIGADGALRPVVTRAGEGDTYVGFVTSVFANTANLTQIYRPASQLGTVFANVDPNVIFEMQADGTVTAADIGQNADISFAVAGDPLFGTSGAQVKVSTFTSSSAQVNIKGIVPVKNNELGDYTRLICTAVEHFYKQTSGV